MKRLSLALTLLCTLSFASISHALTPRQVFEKNPALVWAITTLSIYGCFKEPTGDTTEPLSLELFRKNPTRFVELAIGWFSKEYKVEKLLDAETPQWKAGYKGRGLLGNFEKHWKIALAVSIITVFIKNVESVDETFGLLGLPNLGK